jgi:glycosyltransferase involved in cell wall biosynthesis
VQFHILSFEGPDPYARAGGIASRISGLSEALADLGFETHLWFVGDPRLPGHEVRGNLHLHRWCQWISQHHPVGVYDGEHGKQADYAASLPPHLMSQHLLPALAAGERAVVLAEEWHTSHAVLHLDWLLRQAGARDRVTMLWTANNTFGFERVDWPRLREAAVIATVSRYMRHCMQGHGVDAVVIPNGLSSEVFVPIEEGSLERFGALVRGRTVLAKVARWDPDKRWLAAVDITAELALRGERPLLIARGGAEAHEAQVVAHARALGLRVGEHRSRRSGAGAVLSALESGRRVDLLLLRSHLDAEARRLLFCGSHAVLANSAHEPFGLVGLEAMASGGLAVTGCTGEDYAAQGRNAIVLQTGDPREFLAAFERLRHEPAEEQRIRRAGRQTAREYAWHRVVDRELLPRLELVQSAA